MLRFLNQYLIRTKNINKENIINKSLKEDYSYGNFLTKNPNATKEERKKAIKRFLDKTR